MTKWATVALTFPFAGVVLAEGFSLSSTIDCDLGTNCYIQQYVDRDPGDGISDYRCAGQSYNGHKGTDFALRSIADIDTEIAVLATADGIVEHARDGMADIEYSATIANRVKGRECGNGVQINHGRGWVTQYCHLKQGSVMVAPGQTVSAGDALGHVGMSGQAAFPHVHLSVRKDGKTVDPFNLNETVNCAVSGDNTLWADPPLYRAGGLISVGMSDRIPDYASVKEGTASLNVTSTDARVLVVYGFGFGLRAGDVMHLSIIGPKGEVIAEDIKLTKTQARSFRAIGKNRKWRPWPSGTYLGVVNLIRDDDLIDSAETTIELR